MAGDYRLIPTAADPQTRLAVRMADLERRISRIEDRFLSSDDPWTVTSFSGGWRQYGGGGNTWTPPVLQKTGATVVGQGLIDKNGGNFTANDLIFTLPSGYIPSTNVILELSASGGGLESTTQVRIYGLSAGGSAGQVTIGTHGGPANPVTWVSLGDMVFNVPVV